jgi:Domain of unknown function (DUF1816)
MKELLISILDVFRLACWLKINTDNPRCTYYFGPFLTREDAILEQDGYIEDLIAEEAKGIVVSVKRCKPRDLTIFDELGESRSFSEVLSVSTQAPVNI